MKPLFDNSLPATDRAYINLCKATKPSINEFIEALWARYYPFADSNFPTEIGNSFHERFWEMYLACALMHHGISLEKKQTHAGPDIRVNYRGSRIWIEAIAPKGGDPAKPDSVVEPVTTPGRIVANRVPDEQIILRYRSAIETKFGKHSHYLASNIVKPTDCYVIAMNGCQIHCSMLELDVPRIVRSVLPFGWPTITIDKATNEVIGTGHQYRPAIVKSSRQLVSTDIFLNPDYQAISAILFSCIYAGNWGTSMGDDFICVHNPCACSPLPEDLLRIGREYRVSVSGDEATLVSKDWRAKT